VADLPAAVKWLEGEAHRTIIRFTQKYGICEFIHDKTHKRPAYAPNAVL
jgi:hypothetical protein